MAIVGIVGSSVFGGVALAGGYKMLKNLTEDERKEYLENYPPQEDLHPI